MNPAPPIAARGRHWYFNRLKEVSTSGVRLLLAALERLKMDVRPLIAGLAVSEQELKAPGGRIDWDVWVELIERLEMTLGGPEKLEQFALLSSANAGMHRFSG